MALYRYEAVNQLGKKIQGTIDADYLQDAKAKLKNKQILVTHVSLLQEKHIACKISKKELFSLTREISRLLQAGIPLFEVLTALEEKYSSQKKSHRLLLDLCDQVKSGKPLSEAMNRHPETFDLLYRSMIGNAEKTGRLKEALDELASWISRQLTVKKQMISTLLYPALLAGFCLTVLMVLLFFVVPSMAELFADRHLHPFTQFVIAISRFACESKSALLILMLAVMCVAGLCIFEKSWRSRITKIGSKMIFLKDLLMKVAFVRFCRSCATLLEGGLSIETALSQARSVMGHPILEKVVEDAEEKVKQGEKIHHSFQNHAYIPPLVPRMLGIAEEGGKLPFMMRQIAEIYEEDLEKTLSYVSTVAQPALLLILGIVIGFVLLSVLLPLTDVSSFAN